MLSRKTRYRRGFAVLPLRQLAVFVLAVAALGAAGCGDGSTEPDEPLTTGDIGLAITLDPDGPDGEEEPLTAEVTCDEDESDPECAEAGDLSVAALEPASPETACTEIFGGPDVLQIEGDLGGEEVNYTLTRENGCEIERFDAALPLLNTLFRDYEPGSAIAG